MSGYVIYTAKNVYKKTDETHQPKHFEPPNPNPLHLMRDLCLILGFLSNFPGFFGNFPAFREGDKQNPSENPK